MTMNRTSTVYPFLSADELEKIKCRQDSILATLDKNETGRFLATYRALNEMLHEAKNYPKTATFVTLKFLVSLAGFPSSSSVLDCFAVGAEIKNRIKIHLYKIRNNLLDELEVELKKGYERVEEAEKGLVHENEEFNRDALKFYMGEDITFHREFFLTLCKYADTARKKAEKATDKKSQQNGFKNEHERNTYLEAKSEEFLKKTKRRIRRGCEKINFFDFASNAVAKGVSIEFVRLAAVAAYRPDMITDQTCHLRAELGLTMFNNISEEDRIELALRFKPIGKEFFRFLEYLYTNNYTHLTAHEIRDSFIDVFKTTHTEYATPLHIGDAVHMPAGDMKKINRVIRKTKQILEESLLLSKVTTFNPSKSCLLRDAYQKDDAKYRELLNKKIEQFLKSLKSFDASFSSFLETKRLSRLKEELINLYTTFSSTESTLETDKELIELFKSSINKINHSRNENLNRNDDQSISDHTVSVDSAWLRTFFFSMVESLNLYNPQLQCSREELEKSFDDTLPEVLDNSIQSGPKRNPR